MDLHDLVIWWNIKRRIPRRCPVCGDWRRLVEVDDMGKMCWSCYSRDVLIPVADEVDRQKSEGTWPPPGRTL